MDRWPTMHRGRPRSSIALGARPDVLAAAALGRMDLLRGFFDSDGRLLSCPRRRGKELAARDAIGLALLYAYVRDQSEAIDFLLEKDGNWDMIGVNNGAALHRAAFAGDLPMVQRLVALGAGTSNRNNPFNSTPLAWADHNQQADIVAWLRLHSAVDLHDAVSFDFREHVEARLREDPAAVNRRLDHWDIPLGAPLHWAAAMGHEEAARILLDNGADPNVLSGDGRTPLDVADANDAVGVAALIEERGGGRAPAHEKSPAASTSSHSSTSPAISSKPIGRASPPRCRPCRTSSSRRSGGPTCAGVCPSGWASPRTQT